MKKQFARLLSLLLVVATLLCGIPGIFTAGAEVVDTITVTA